MLDVPALSDAGLVSLGFRPQRNPSKATRMLQGALEAAQNLPCLELNEVNPAALPKWPTGKSVLEAVNRVSIGEALSGKAGQKRLCTLDEEADMRRLVASMQGMAPSPDDLQDGNPFVDLRQTVLHLAKNWEDSRGRPAPVLMMDPEKTASIQIKIVSVLKVDSGTPIIFVAYSPLRVAPPEPHDMKAEFEWLLKDHMTPRGANVTANNASLCEQHLMFQLLEANAARISSKAQEARSAYDKRHSKLSFILPLLPVASDVRAKLEGDETICFECGSPPKPGMKMARCARCGNAVYCGKECQAGHWRAEHKKVCRDLKSAESVTLRFWKGTADYRYSNTINRHAAPSRMKAPKEDDALLSNAPPNAHGEGFFVVKIQIPGLPGYRPAPIGIQDHIMVYDGARSFTRIVNREDCPQAYDKIRQTTIERGCLPIKGFFYARRTGDFDLEVVHEHMPAQDQTW